MQSNQKIIQALISKIQSPLSQIRNRAITTLFTKVSARIITQIDLIRSKQLPGILLNWINETTPPNKQCLYKVLSILHRYTLTQQGIGILFEYQSLEFLEQFRKFLMTNDTNIDEHVYIIKTIIKQLLPLQNKKEKSLGQVSLDNNKNNRKDFVEQNDADDDLNQKKNTKKNNQSKQVENKRNKNKKQSHIINFMCLSDPLPKTIDQELYSLVIQLKHGKKKSILQTLLQIEQILNYWGWMYFSYKQQLIRELVNIIQGKIYSQLACRIIAILIKQFIQMENDLEFQLDKNQQRSIRNHLKVSKISNMDSKINIKHLEVQLKFEIFMENPFTNIIFNSFITNKQIYLKDDKIHFLIKSLNNFSFSGLLLPDFLQKISQSKEWVEVNLKKKEIQKEFFNMINHCCEVQQNLYSKISPLLSIIFPKYTIQQLSEKIPFFSRHFQQSQIIQSFQVLCKYNPSNKKLTQTFDFNLQLHNIQTHLKNLQKGLPGLPKDTQIISLYIDCMLMLSVAVAKQDQLMSFYPKIKQLILKISEHEYLNVRKALYEQLLIVFNTSENVNYLAKGYLKSQLIRLVFTDSDFYHSLFRNAINQDETLIPFLQMTKIIQNTTKQDNRKYLNKFVSIFYLLSLFGRKQNKNQVNIINQSSKIIISRVSKKYQAVNILLSLFSKSKQQRQNTYKNILGLSDNHDLLNLALNYYKAPQKKHLKYSLSTIKNYMNIIMNQNIDNSVKKSAIEQMIQCVNRIDLQLLQKEQQLLKQIFVIHNSVENFIKQFLQKPDEGLTSLFVQLVRIYSILEKRLRLQTNYLNQTVKYLQPQVYLNILINLCNVIDQQTDAISDFLGVIYIHCMTTFTSDLLYIHKQKEQRKKSLEAHWIIKIYPHQAIFDIKVNEKNKIAKNSTFSEDQNSKKVHKGQQKLLQGFLKGYNLNLKSFKELVHLYQVLISQLQTLNQEEIKLKKKIISPIIQRQLSYSIHNINQNQNQLSFLRFFMIQCHKKYPKSNFFQSLQQIIPHILNQLIKPNLPIFIKNLLTSIINVIGLKRTKQVQSLINQIDNQQLYLLQIVKKMTKISSDQYQKIIKSTLSVQTQSIKMQSKICVLYNILLKPGNIKIFIQSSSQYSKMMILNNIMKQIQNPFADSKLINYSSILLYKLLIQTYKSISSVNLRSFDDIHQNENIQKKQLLKLINSLSIGPNIINFLLKELQNKNSQSTLTNQSFCYLLECLKVLFKLDNIAFQIMQNQLQSNNTYTNKVLKIFLIKLGQIVNSNSYFSQIKSMKMFYCMIFNFFNGLIKLRSFYKTISQFDLLDIAVNIFSEKTKELLIIKIDKNKNNQLIESFLLLSSLSEYILLKVQSDPAQISHYLLSSTNFLEGFIDILSFTNSKISEISQIDSIKKSLKQFLENLSKVLHIVSLNQQDYFIFKLNQFRQNQNINYFNLLGNLVQITDENFMIFFMRFIIIWQQKKSQNKEKKLSKKFHDDNLNPLQIFEEDSQEQDDSSIQDNKMHEKIKNSFQNHWIYKTVKVAIERNQIVYLKSLLALSIPAKIFFIQNNIFLSILKKFSHKIDSKIVHESKKSNKKQIGPQKSVLLSQSRRTVISQQPSYINQKSTEQSQQKKIQSFEDFMKLLTSLFYINQQYDQQKLDLLTNRFVKCTNQNKQSLKRLFYIIDKLYQLSQILNTDIQTKKSFVKTLMKMISSLSESSIFSLSLSNHLTQTASPIIQESIQFILKGLSTNQNQSQYQKLKQAFQILTTLSNHESVRSYIFKNKLIEQLNSKLIKYEQKRTQKSDYINLNCFYDIVNFYLSLSKHKDSHTKILNDKKVLEVLINQVYMQKSNLLSEKILQLLSNLAAYKSNKPIFMQNRQIHKTILGQLESEQIQYKCHLIVLLYNLVYRHAAAVKLYKRKDVIDMLHSIESKSFENWENIRQIQQAILEVLESQQNVPDKN